MSEQFKALQKRLRTLKENLLPKQFSSTGDYTERQIDRAIGYRLLVHAEIEGYLESISLSIISDAIRDWQRHRKPTRILLSFLACYHSGWNTNDSSTEYTQSDKNRLSNLAQNREKIFDRDSYTVEDIIQNAQKQYRNILKNNHGIKKENLKNLLTPTGININELDHIWITTLDEFGTLRGEVAHSSRSAIQLAINPEEEYRKVIAILDGLKDLDRKLSAIKANR